MKNNNKWMFLSSSTLKIIGMILMFIDHFAVQFSIQLGDLYFPLRVLGRIAFPIFAYLITDGMIHSKNKIKYILQMLILGIIIEFVDQSFIHMNQGNIMITLATSAIIIYFLQRNNWYEKLISIIPLTIVLLAENKIGIIDFTFQYGIYGIILIVGFYLCYLLCAKIVEKINKDEDLNEKLHSQKFILFRNIISCLFLIVFNIIWFFFAKSVNYYNEITIKLQFFAVLSCLVIIFYSGKRGYNKKWFKWFCYLYYPLQFILVYVLYLLLV